jgi:ribosomal protein S18 acetylase RimI-like enzyme
VIAVWQSTGLVREWNDPGRDIDRKTAFQPELFLVAVSDNADTAEVVGTVMGGYDGHRGSISYLGVLPSQQGRGIGAALVRAVEERVKALGCPKVNLQVRIGNEAVYGFYEHLGYERFEVSDWGRRLIAD